MVGQLSSVQTSAIAPYIKLMRLKKSTTRLNRDTGKLSCHVVHDSVPQSIHCQLLKHPLQSKENNSGNVNCECQNHYIKNWFNLDFFLEVFYRSNFLLKNKKKKEIKEKEKKTEHIWPWDNTDQIEKIIILEAILIKRKSSTSPSIIERGLSTI